MIVLLKNKYLSFMDSIPNQSELQTYHRHVEEMFGDLYAENKALFDELPNHASIRKIMVFLDGVEQTMDYWMEEKGKTKEEVLRSAIKSLSKENRLWLITPAQFATLPDGTELVTVFGEKIVKGKDEVHVDETRSGFLAYGFMDGAEIPNGVDINKRGLYFIEERGGSLL